MRSKESNYDNYNFQGKLISNLADSLFLLEEQISSAYQEKPSDFLKALSDSNLFVDKIIGMKLKFNPKTIKLINLYLKLAKIKFEENNLIEGATYLSKSYQKICNIIKMNDMMFPRIRKVTSFKNWAEQQVG